MRQLKISKQITNRESQSLDKYLQEIGKVDLLTPDEEVTLAQKIREGDQLSLERLTKAGAVAEIHVYQKGRHGFGSGSTNGIYSDWMPRLEHFLKQSGFIPGGKE